MFGRTVKERRIGESSLSYEFWHMTVAKADVERYIRTELLRLMKRQASDVKREDLISLVAIRLLVAFIRCNLRLF